MRRLFFVSCTQGPKEATRLWKSLEKMGHRDFYFFEQNRRGLGACYNEFLDRFAGTSTILALVHDDVLLADLFLAEKLQTAIDHFDVVGVVGSATFNLQVEVPNYNWAIWPLDALSGAVDHDWGMGFSSWLSIGPVPRACLVLDGLFLAVDMLTIGAVRFDPQFDFHCYDLDFGLSVHQAGLLSGTANLYMQHGSMGNYDSPAYLEAMKRFQHKWRAINPV